MEKVDLAIAWRLSPGSNWKVPKLTWIATNSKPISVAAAPALQPKKFAPALKGSV